MKKEVEIIHNIPVQIDQKVDVVKLKYQRYKIIKKSILGIAVFFGVAGLCRLVMI